MVALISLAVLIAAFAGLVVLARRSGRISEEEYRARLGKQSQVGNALLDAQVLLEPGREALRKAKEEVRVQEDDSGDPPPP